MKKSIRIITIVLVLALLLSGSSLAVSNNIDSISCISELVDLWKEAKDKQIVFLNEEGKLELRRNFYDRMEKLSLFISMWNEGIEAGIYSVDEDTLEISCTDLVNNLNVSEDLKSPIMKSASGGFILENVFQSAAVIPASTYHCNLPDVDLIGLCEMNYNNLVSYYNAAVLIKELDPGNAADPYQSTVTYFIIKVRPYGDWDYKRLPGYSPYDKEFCTQLNSSFQHITSEFIGNFNYGYTGSFLFSLDILLAGSYVVSGFNPADEMDDWPVIEEGYSMKAG